MTSVANRKSTAVGRSQARSRAWPFAGLLASTSFDQLRHPSFLVALLVTAVILVRTVTGNRLAYGEVDHAYHDLQLALLVAGAGAYFAGASLGSRARRFGVEELYLSLPTSSRVRDFVLYGSALVPTAVASVLAAGFHVAVVRLPGMVGPSDPWELSTGPTVVLLASVLGIAVARVVKWSGVVAVAFGFLCAVTMFGIAATGSAYRWLAPVVPTNPFERPPAWLDARPTAMHELWLMALVSTSVVLAMLGSARRLRCSLYFLAGALALSLVGAAQISSVRHGEREIDGEAATMRMTPSSFQRCETGDSATVCFFPQYKSWTDAWLGVVDDQLATVPAQAVPDELVVRQQISLPPMTEGRSTEIRWDELDADNARVGTGDVIPVGTDWSQIGVDQFSQSDVLAFSAATAARLVAGPVPGQTDHGAGLYCGSRGAMIYWLMLQPEAAQSAAGILASHGSSDVLTVATLRQADRLIVGPREVLLGRDMVRSQDAVLRSQIADNWDVLVDQNTSIEVAAEILGLPAPSAQGFEEFLCN